MKSFWLIVIACASLTGCASTYTYDGARYPNKEAFEAAVDSKLAKATADVQPLSSPVSKKRLVFAIPSEQLIFRQSAANFAAAQGRTIGLGEEMIARPVWSASYKGLKAFHDEIVRRNIYAQVRYVELDTMSPDLQATPTEDVFYYSEPKLGSGQWYYTSIRAGKQAFSYDRGGPDMFARTKARLDAIQVYAIRD